MKQKATLNTIKLVNAVNDLNQDKDIINISGLAELLGKSPSDMTKYSKELPDFVNVLLKFERITGVSYKKFIVKDGDNYSVNMEAVKTFFKEHNNIRQRVGIADIANAMEFNSLSECSRYSKRAPFKTMVLLEKIEKISKKTFHNFITFTDVD